ncbi:hypothetical protein SUDANB121_03648 [Nocardiopsis dassonvillei]|uniref:hypothetical protein n=1 Tax=Nocardiopsis dassonvillei TaxID=2014 RepID=UPI003F56967D
MSAAPGDIVWRARIRRRTERLRRVRRYAVPRAMIERATERRLAGDWHGACAAAGVDVAIDLSELRRRHGAETADAVREDLLHLVPDLLRWHFPRSPQTPSVPAPETTFELSRPGGDRGPWLTARTLRGRADSPQRIVLDLRFVFRPGRRDHADSMWSASRYLWDARHVHETRERWGGSADRVPFLDPDGTPRSPDLLPTEDPGHTDPAARTEWIDGLYRSGRVAQALAAAGIVSDPGDFPEGSVPAHPFLSPVRLAAEFPRLTAAGGPRRTGIRLGEEWSAPWLEVRGDAGRTRLGHLERTAAPLPLPEALWERPPDIDLVLAGMSPDHLHPLVREALAPARPPADGPVGPPPGPPPAPVRVRCRGEWHTVVPTGGRFVVPHEDAEVAREAAMHALGGSVAGCFPVVRAWTTGRGRLPKALRLLRADLFERIRNGDTDAVLAYLDAGGDPGIRSGEGNTLLHRLHLLDHEALVSRPRDAGDRDGSAPPAPAPAPAPRPEGGVPLLRALLDAGLDLDAVNRNGFTPLGLAAHSRGGVPLLRALLDAGARTEGIAPGRDGSGRRDLADLVGEPTLKRLREEAP